MKKAFDLLEKFVHGLVTATMFAFIVLVSMQVFWRYVLSDPLPWTEQAARYLFIWMLMLEMPILLRRDNNISFDLLYKRLPEKVRHVVQIALLVLIAAFGIVFFVGSFQLCVKSLGKTAVGLGIPIVWVYAAQPTGAALLALVAIEQSVKKIIAWRKGEEAENS